RGAEGGGRLAVAGWGAWVAAGSVIVRGAFAARVAGEPAIFHTAQPAGVPRGQTLTAGLEVSSGSVRSLRTTMPFSTRVEISLRAWPSSAHVSPIALSADCVRPLPHRFRIIMADRLIAGLTTISTDSGV